MSVKMKDNEKTLAERIYEMHDRTQIDTMVLMNTYIMQESKLYARNMHQSKGAASFAKGFEDETLKIMERYIDIHYTLEL